MTATGRATDDRSRRSSVRGVRETESRGREDGAGTRHEEGAVRALQQVVGNRAVGELVERGRAQPALRIGAAGDESEREADRVRRQATRAVDRGRQSGASEDCPGCRTANRNRTTERDDHPGSGRNVSRRGPGPAARDGEANRVESRGSGATGFGRPTPPMRRAGGSAGSGRPLDETALEPMEAAFGRDLSHVRIHTGRRAATAAAATNANAFAVGHEIFFGAGRYAPGTNAGLGLLAHELTHVVQQSRGETRVQFDQDADDVARRFVEEGLNPHDVARRLARSHMSQRDRRSLLRSYYTQYYLTWRGTAPGPEMLAEQVEWIDRMVRERQARQEWERRRQLARLERERRRRARRRRFIDYWTRISPIERLGVIQNELDVGEEIGPVRRLYAFIDWCYEVRGVQVIGDEQVDGCLHCETTTDWFGREEEKCHYPYDAAGAFFFRTEDELRATENELRERLERRRRQTGIPQAEFERQGRQLKAELNLGAIQNALLGTVEGPAEAAIWGWSAATAVNDAYECVHHEDEESCVKAGQSFLSNFSKGMLKR